MKILITILGLIAIITMTTLAIRNAKPICHDIIRSGRGLACVYELGEIEEDQADVIMAERE